MLCYVYSHFIDIRPTIRTYGAFYGRVFARMSYASVNNKKKCRTLERQRATFYCVAYPFDL